jgi:hypothetical protein
MCRTAVHARRSGARQRIFGVVTCVVLLALEGCGHQPAPAGSGEVNNHAGAGGPASADVSKVVEALAGNKADWTANDNCLSDASMDALFADHWIDPSASVETMDGKSGTSYGTGHCEYSSPIRAMATQGARYLLMYSTDTDAKLPGAIEADQLGGGSQVVYAYDAKATQYGQTSCSITVPMIEPRLNVSSKSFYAVTMYQRTGRYGADEMCQTALKVLQANAVQNWATSDPNDPNGDIVPGFTANQTTCSDQNIATLTSAQQRACGDAGFVGGGE